MSARRTDLANGWYEVARNPLSKVGVFPYLARSINAPDKETNPNRVYQVYRPEEELGDPDAVRSFRLTPWVNDHAMLGDPEIDPSLTAPEAKGVHGVIGEQTQYDPSDRTLYGNIRLWSPTLAAAVDAGKKELSCGFRCVYEFVTGNFEGQPYDAIQRKIRGNHLASVEHGRMGPSVAVMDSFSFALDANELREVNPMANKVARKINVAARLGVAVGALPAYFGMDKADDAAKLIFNTAMDAEEDPAAAESSGGVTLEEVGAMLDDAAPALAAIVSAAATIAGVAPAAEPAASDDDMEPVVDGAGNPVMDEAGKPKMQKKAAATDAVPAAIATTDAAIAAMDGIAGIIRKSLPKGAAVPPRLAAMDGAIATAKTRVASAKSKIKTGGHAAMDSIEKRLVAVESRPAFSLKDTLVEAGKSSALAKRVSPFVGTFACDGMTENEVATYALDKLEIKDTPKGQEVAALNAYLHGRAAPAAAKTEAFGMDAAAVKPDASLSAYISGGKNKAA